MPQQPRRIAVTGAAGQICYALLFRIARGDASGLLGHGEVPCCSGTVMPEEMVRPVDQTNRLSG